MIMGMLSTFAEFERDLMLERTQARMLPIVNRKFPAPNGITAKMFEEARIAPQLKTLKDDVIGDVASTSQTVTFADSAGTWIDPWPTGTPVLIEVPLLEPPSGQYPAVHFRHAGTANVLFLDGHVEGVSPGTRNPPPSWETPSANALRDKERLFDIGGNDDLWDRQ